MQGSCLLSRAAELLRSHTLLFSVPVKKEDECPGGKPPGDAYCDPAEVTPRLSAARTCERTISGGGAKGHAGRAARKRQSRAGATHHPAEDATAHCLQLLAEVVSITDSHRRRGFPLLYPLAPGVRRGEFPPHRALLLCTPLPLCLSNALARTWAVSFSCLPALGSSGNPQV